MARPTLPSLARVAGDARWPDIDAEPHLESCAQAVAEESNRVAGLVRGQKFYPDKVDVLAAATLTYDLQRGLDGYGMRPTLASALYSRELRLAMVEQVWQLVLETGASACFTWTVIPPSWIIPFDELSSLSARTLMERSRAWLYSNGVRDAGGWLIYKLDAEFDPGRRLVKFHLHGIGSPAMRPVIERLRGMPLLQPNRVPAETGYRVKRPVRIADGVKNLPYPISYALKCHIASRWSGVVGSGEFKRRNRPMRASEPYHTLLLLWLNSQPVADFFGTYGISVRDRQLVRTA